MQSATAPMYSKAKCCFHQQQCCSASVPVSIYIVFLFTRFILGPSMQLTRGINITMCSRHPLATDHRCSAYDQTLCYTHVNIQRRSEQCPEGAAGASSCRSPVIQHTPSRSSTPCGTMFTMPSIKPTIAVPSPAQPLSLSFPLSVLFRCC